MDPMRSCVLFAVVALLALVFASRGNAVVRDSGGSVAADPPAAMQYRRRGGCDGAGWRLDRWDGLLLGATLATLDANTATAWSRRGAGLEYGVLAYFCTRSDLPGPSTSWPTKSSKPTAWAPSWWIAIPTPSLQTTVPAFELRLQGASYEARSRRCGILSTCAQCAMRRKRHGCRNPRRASPPWSATAHHRGNQVRLRARLRQRTQDPARGGALGGASGSRLRTTFLAAHRAAARVRRRTGPLKSTPPLRAPRLHAKGCGCGGSFAKPSVHPAQTRRMFEAARTLGTPVKRMLTS